MSELKTFPFAMMQRKLTEEEKFYNEMMFLALHYRNGSDKTLAIKKCSALLDRVMKSDLPDDFKKYYKYLFSDQASKIHETHENWAKTLKRLFEGTVNKYS